MVEARNDEVEGWDVLYCKVRWKVRRTSMSGVEEDGQPDEV
jgi:hypothetical protein